MRVLSLRVLPAQRVTIRSILAAAEILTGVVLAHVIAGGQLPAWPVLLVSGLAIAAAGRFVLLGKLRLRWAVPLLTATQFFLHSWWALMEATSAHHMGWHLTAPMIAAHLAGAAVTAAVWAVRRRAVDVAVWWTEALLVLLARPVPVAHSALLRLTSASDWLTQRPVRGPPNLGLAR